jgi:hypothetical protein
MGLIFTEKIWGLVGVLIGFCQMTKHVRNMYTKWISSYKKFAMMPGQFLIQRISPKSLISSRKQRSTQKINYRERRNKSKAQHHQI